VEVGEYTDSCEDLDDEDEDDEVKWREREREARKKFLGRVGIAFYKLSKCSQKEKLNFKFFFKMK